MKGSDIIIKLNNGKTIPALGFGTGNPPETTLLTKQAVVDAVKAGYRHIDTGWRYNTEHLIGEALQELFEAGVVTREELFVTTKVPPQFHATPEDSLKQSLERLKLDYVDLWLQHWPIAWEMGENFFPIPKDLTKNANLKENDFKIDPNGNYVSAYLAMEKVLNDGTNRVRSLGISNYCQSYIEELLKVCTIKPVVNQLELHPHLSQPELVKFMKSQGIVSFAYGPLGMDGAPNLKIPLVVELAKKYDCGPGNILLSYHLCNGNGVVARSTNVKRIENNLTLINLEKNDLNKLNQFGVDHAKRFNDKFINFKALFDDYYK